MISYFRKHLSRMGLLAFSVDFSILLLTGILALILINRLHFLNQLSSNHIQIIYVYLIAFIILSQISLFISELYITEKRYQNKILIFKCFISFIIVSIACYTISRHVLPYYNYLFFSMAACTLILCWRFVFYWIVEKFSIQHKVLFFGTDELSQTVVREILADDHPRFKVTGFVSTDPSLVGKHLVRPRVLGIGKDLASIVEKEKIHRLVVSFPQGRRTFPSQDLLFCKFKGIHVQDLHTFYEHLIRSMRRDAEKYSGPVWAKENDPRITRVGL